MKKFILHFVLFVFVIGFCQWIISNFIPSGSPMVIEVLKTALRRDIQMIGLGDSGIFYTGVDDDDERSTYRILDDLMEDKSLVDIASRSHHVGLYEHFYSYIARHGPSVEYVLMPINLRTFSPLWDKHPIYDFEKETAYLTVNAFVMKWLHQPMAVFKCFIPRSKFYDYDRASVTVGGKVIGTVKDFEPERFATYSVEYYSLQMILAYMADLDVEHRKLISIQHILNMSRKTGVKPVFYIVPIDYEHGREYIGEAFIKKVRRNVDLICSLFDAYDVECLDFSMALDKHHFYWYDDAKRDYLPNEHLTFAGRKFLAEELYTYIQSLDE